MDLSKITVKYFIADHLHKCLNSICKFVKTGSFEVNVVDIICLTS